MGLGVNRIKLSSEPNTADLFLHLPEITTANLQAAADANEGGIVYDATTNTVKFSDGASWANIGAAASLTLDQAFDNGKVIDAANSSANAFRVGDGTRDLRIWGDGTDVQITTVNGDLLINPAGGDTAITGNLSVTGTFSPTTATITTGTITTLTATTATITTMAGAVAFSGNPTVTGTATTGSIFLIDGSTVTTGNVLRVEADATTLNGGLLINGTIDGTSKFSVAEDGKVTIAGTAAGSDALILTAGDITLTAGHIVQTLGNLTLTNGNLTMSSGGLDVTPGAGDGDAFDLTNLAASAAIDLDVVGSSTVAGGVIDIDASTGSAPILTMAFSGAYTGGAVIVDMTNAVGAIALTLTGAGTRTAHLVSITDVPTASAATFDLNITMANDPAFDIDCAGTGTGGLFDIDFSAAFTGDAVNINMTNAVGANCLDLTGAGTRTVPFITITDVPTTSAPTFDINITPGAGVQAGFDIDVAGTQAADIIAIDFSAAFTGDALNITMTNGGAGAQAIVVDGSLAASGAMVSLSSSGVLTANGSILTCAASGQPGAANTGTCGRFLDTGAAQATTYAVQIDSTSNEALTVTTGKAHFVEAISSLASNRCGISDNYVQAAGSNNAITVAAITDAAGTTIPLADGLTLVIDCNTRTLQAGANTLDYAGGGAVSITRSTAPTGNKAVATAANAVVALIYSSGATAWLDLSE